MFGKKEIMWSDVVNAYVNNARDVKTDPKPPKGANYTTNPKGIWFYVYAENGNIYIESARNHSNSSRISGRRKLENEKFDAMLSLYKRRKKGEAVSQEATSTTRNQVYWYGIFADMSI